MYSRLYHYLSINHILSDSQFGVRRNHSTCLALINVIDEIYQHIDNRDKVLGMYLDLQKAYDSIDHDILLFKLYTYGTRGKIFDWFKDYLSNRSQYVCVNCVSSNTVKVNCGVPHGNVLGPLLFLLFVNDIENCIPNIAVKLYADDTNLFIFDKKGRLFDWQQ